MKIKLIKPHTHAGEAMEAGRTLDVPEDTARWLIAHGVAEARPVKPRSTDVQTARKEG